MNTRPPVFGYAPPGGTDHAGHLGRAGRAGLTPGRDPERPCAAGHRGHAGACLPAARSGGRHARPQLVGRNAPISDLAKFSYFPESRHWATEANILQFKKAMGSAALTPPTLAACP